MVDMDISGLRDMDDLVLKIWSLTTALITSLTVVLSVLYPKQFYNQFIWKYFWGPIVADGHGVDQVERINDNTYIPSSGLEEAVTAEPGYTVVSTFTYGVILIFMLIGARALIDRMDYQFTKETAVALVPLIIFGGLMRVMEDLNVFIYLTTDSFLVPFPYSSLFISPIIYFVLFGIGVALVFSAYRLPERYGSSERIIAISGTVLSIAALLLLIYASLTYESIDSHLSVLLLVTFLSLSTSVVLYKLLKKYTNLTDGVGVGGLVLLIAHTLDGFANVVSLDWLPELGISGQYSTKHVVNRGIQIATERIQPEWLSELIGITWPFAVVKIGIVVFLLWVLNEEFFDESRQMAVLTLIVATAVGLGPATRDITRVVLGI